jgi:hypothetical protein
MITQTQCQRNLQQTLTRGAEDWIAKGLPKHALRVGEQAESRVCRVYDNQSSRGIEVTTHACSRTACPIG